MKPSEFVSFKDKKPSKHKHIIVTNNIEATDAFGEMSHVWMCSSNLVKKSEKEGEGIITITADYRYIYNLSHWKYA